MAAHMKWKQELQAFCKANMAQVQRLTYELCAIPAPTGSEGRRAQFCLSYLRGHGAAAYLDEAGNVVFPYACEGSGKVLVLAAHMDTVFPEARRWACGKRAAERSAPALGMTPQTLPCFWCWRHGSRSMPRTHGRALCSCATCARRALAI